MLSSLLITLREGLEATLIIGIMLAYLSRTEGGRGKGQVWLGTGLAVLASLVAGAVIYLTAGELSGRAEQAFEGTATIVAAAVLTWMIFWMRRQAVNIRASLHAEIRSALDRGAALGLVTLAFIAVVREGVETALFLFAASRTAGSPLAFVVGGLIGLLLAVLIGLAVYRGTSRLNLRTFFNITGLILIVFSAGLFAYGIHEFNEGGMLPPLVAQVWNTGRVLPDESGLGRFLAALFGYTSDPSLLQVIGYFGYLGVMLWAYLRRAGRPLRPEAQTHGVLPNGKGA